MQLSILAAAAQNQVESQKHARPDHGKGLTAGSAVLTHESWETNVEHSGSYMIYRQSFMEFVCTV